MSNAFGPWDPVTEFIRPIPSDRDGRVEGDSFRIGGDWCPGIAIARKASDPRKWDKRAGYGISGATLVYMGDDLSAFSIDVSIWTQTQMNEWKTFFGKYLKKPAPPKIDPKSAFAAPPVAIPKALGLYNPRLAMLGISTVVVEDVTQFEQVGDGIEGCTIDVQVYRAPLPILVKPNGKIPDVNGKGPDAKDEAERLIKEKLAKIDALEKNLANGGR